MSSIAKGGRGKTAPYSTGHYRIPIPLKPLVAKLANAYRNLIDEDRTPEPLLKAVEAAIEPIGTPPTELNSLEQAHEIKKLKAAIALLEEDNQIAGKLLIHARAAQREADRERAELEEKIQELEERAPIYRPANPEQKLPKPEELAQLERENLELHAKVGDLGLECQMAQERISYLQEQISDLLNKQDLVRQDKEEIDSLKRQFKELEKDWDDTQLAQLKAATILNHALELKANAGGAIKAKIREALPLIADI